MRSSDCYLPPRPGAKPRVLVVDDNIDAANSLGRLLKLLGNEVFVAHDGASAIAQIGHFQPAVVLLDLGMPIMDGYQAAEHIRARPDCQQVALIAITGWGQDQDRHRTEEAGFAAHLIKPVNVEHLEKVLARVMAVQPSVTSAASTR